MFIPLLMSSKKTMILGKILLNKKVISSDQLEEVIRLQASHHKKIGELLMMQGYIQESELQQALKEQYWRRNGYWMID